LQVGYLLMRCKHSLLQNTPRFERIREGRLPSLAITY
jgi:hypothetical protein